MATIHIEPVIEAPYYEGEPPWPWPVARVKPYSIYAIGSKSTPDDVGLILGLLSKDNSLDLENTADWADQLDVEPGELILSGGVAVRVENGTDIVPGCCSGLEAWASFWKYAHGEKYAHGVDESPWWGHDPAPYLRQEGADVLIWRDGAIEPVSGEIEPIRVPVDEFKRQMESVHRELAALLDRLRDWLISRSINEPERVIYAINKAFAIVDPERYAGW